MRARHGALAVLCLTACGTGAPAPPERLELVQIRPKSSEGVFLNEDLVLHFSAPVDPVSITTESLRIRRLDADGAPAERALGRFEIVGDRVRFLPRPVLAPDLTDGGYLPGERYEVELRGFPSPDCVRGTDGRPLDGTLRWSFGTALRGEPPGPMFDDASPERGERLRLVRRRIGAGEGLRFHCAEPLDPATVLAGDFELREELDAAGETRLGAPIPLRARLVHNDLREPAGPGAAAVLELLPAPGSGAEGGGGFREGVYRLRVEPDTRLRDFGGNRVWATPPGDPWIRVQVLYREERGQYVESFLGPERRSLVPVPGADGTAHWGPDGALTLRFPRAAGLGRDGRVTLGGEEARADLHASRLALPARVRCELAAPGLVVLRSQGSLWIAGDLVRGGGPGPSVADDLRPGEDLHAWLERAREREPAWTVLVAGGDLVVEGSIDVAGPLLLAAGGRLRLSGSVRAQDGELWLVGEGGGLDAVATARHARLELGPPPRDGNPLVEPLRFACLSDPIPSAGVVERWLSAEVRARARLGSYRVRFLDAATDLSADPELWGLVDDPKDLRDARALRLLLELEARPPVPGRRETFAWEPPIVDEVRVHWDPLGSGGVAMSLLELPREVLLAWWAVVGCFVGSFLNVVVYRYPLEGVTPASPRRSRCPECGTSCAGSRTCRSPRGSRSAAAVARAAGASRGATRWSKRSRAACGCGSRGRRRRRSCRCSWCGCSSSRP